MSTIGIIGVTGYVGSHVAEEALARGHEVIGVTPNRPRETPAGVELLVGSFADPALREDLFARADSVLVAVRAGRQPLLLDSLEDLLKAAKEHGTRLGFMGGAASLLMSPGGIRVLDRPGFPEAMRPEAEAHVEVLKALHNDTSGADWFYISPAIGFGPSTPGERTGHYRTDTDVAVTDSEGKSFISGADLAVAFVDEIEVPRHHRQRFSVGY
ncbi:MAG: NAD(P)H-binding protein [Solirubrobacterales bacterium]|nr:NAD(P)H-binding protein [Solirubrobacterales bacterium]